MRLRLFNVLAGVSLLLFATTNVLWATTWRNPHSVRYSSPRCEVFVLTERGLVQVDVVRGDTTDRGWAFDDFRRFGDWGWYTVKMFGPTTGWGALLTPVGFGGWSHTRDIGYGFWGARRARLPAYELFFPLWFLILCWMIPPSFFLKNRYRQHRRRRNGLCTSCGY